MSAAAWSRVALCAQPALSHAKTWTDPPANVPGFLGSWCFCKGFKGFAGTKSHFNNRISQSRDGIAAIASSDFFASAANFSLVVSTSTTIVPLASGGPRRYELAGEGQARFFRYCPLLQFMMTLEPPRFVELLLLACNCQA